MQDRADVLLTLAADMAERPVGDRMKHARNALDLATQCGDLTRQHKAIYIIREQEFKAGALEGFMRSAIRAMEIAERMGSADIMADDLIWLGRGYTMNGLHEKAVEMARKSLALRMASGDPAAVANARLHWLNALREAGHVDVLMREWDATHELFRKLGDATGSARGLILKAKVFMDRGKPADALTVLYEAREVCGTTIPAAVQLDLSLQMTRAELALGRLEMARHRSREAWALVEEVAEHAQQIELLELDSRLAEARGDLAAALRAERQRATMKESYTTARALAQVADLQVLYQVGQKDRDIAQMRTTMEESERLMAVTKARQRLQGALVLCLGLALVLSVSALLTRRRMLRRIQASKKLIQEQAETLQAKNIELERQQLRLRETLISEEEKNVLLKEIHHRVKNNLQIVSSMLGLQATHAQGTPVAEILMDSLGRVKAMGLVHENTYRHGDLSRVDVAGHLTRLAKEVLSVHGVQNRLSITIDAEVPPATIDTLIPLSLLLNELMTNSIKHAYPPGARGVIRIHLTVEQAEMKLTYSDDGTPSPVQHSSNGVGRQLIEALTKQLEGSFRMLNGDGTTYLFSFPASSPFLRKAS